MFSSAPEPVAVVEPVVPPPVAAPVPVINSEVKEVKETSQDIAADIKIPEKEIPSESTNAGEEQTS